MALTTKKKKLLGLLTVGAVGGGLLYNMMGTASGESSDNGNGEPEEDEMVVATKIEELTGNQRYTFKEYSSNDAPASLNPFNKVGGGNLKIEGSSGSDNQYQWKSNDSKLKLVDHDDFWPLGPTDSGAMHMKVAKGFAVKVKLVSENTDYFSEFSGLSEALANRDSKMKVVGSSKGDTITQIKDDIQRIWENDEMTFMMYEGDYISIDIDSEHDNIAKFRIQIDGVKYDNDDGAIDDDCSIKLKKVYKVTPVDVWASETFTLGSETIVFSGPAGWLGRVGRKTWLRVTSNVGTKASKKRALKELDDLATLGIDTKHIVRGGGVTNVTNHAVAGTVGRRSAAVLGGEVTDVVGMGFLKGFSGKGARFAWAIGPTVMIFAVGGGLYSWVSSGGLGKAVADAIAGPPCSETCDGYDEGSEEEVSCLDKCVGDKDKRILILGGIAVVGGLGVSYLLLSKLIPKSNKQKVEIEVETKKKEE